MRYVQIPACANCKNVHCKDTNHVTDIDDCATNIPEILDTSIKSVTMKSSKSNARPKVVPGWSEAVNPFREDAIFWHAVWKSSGKPLNNYETNKELISLCNKKMQKSVEQIKKNKLLDACINDKGNIFDEFREIRHVKRDLVRCARKVYNVKEWTIIRDIQLGPNKPTATETGKPTFDCVPCNKSFPKIHFIFVFTS